MANGTRRMAPGSVTRREAVALLGGVALGAATLGLCGCGSDAGAGAKASAGAAKADARRRRGDFRIGVLQIADHAALERTRKGIAQALDAAGVRYRLDVQVAKNDFLACQGMAAGFSGGDHDLIVALGTPAAQAAVGATSNVPIVATAVTDLAAAGLLDNAQVPGGNVTGAADLTPVERQFDLLRQLLPGAGRVGILYCSQESNSEVQASMAEDAASARGLASERFRVAGAGELEAAVRSMAGKVDACYVPTDNTVAASIGKVAAQATAAKLPLVCGEAGMVEAGGLATVGIDYLELGKAAGSMAARVLGRLQREARPRKRDAAAKQPTADMAVWQPDGAPKVVVNQQTARALGIDTSALDTASLERA